MRLRPLQDRVVIRRVEPEAKSAGGIFIIPDTAREKPTEGEIFAVGPGVRDETGKLHPLDVEAGDRPVATRKAAQIRRSPAPPSVERAGR